MFSKFLIKTSFNTRFSISLILFSLGTIYVLSPKEFQPFLLVTNVVFTIAYFFVYLRYDVRTIRLLLTKKTSMPTISSNFDIETEKIFQSFSEELGDKIRIRFSNKVDNFEARGSHKIIYVNPTYAKTANKQEIEASLYHELGHIKEFWSYFFDAITFASIPMFYWMFFTVISIARGELPIIPIISTWVLVRLVMIIISWRNEYRADRFASKYVSLGSLEKMLEPVPVKSNVETHPSPSKRLKKIRKNLKNS